MVKVTINEEIDLNKVWERKALEIYRMSKNVRYELLKKWYARLCEEYTAEWKNKHTPRKDEVYNDDFY